MIREWASEASLLVAEGDHAAAVRAYCTRLTDCADATLLANLGGGENVRANVTHLAKLAALGRQQKLAHRLSSAVDAAVEALSHDGFLGLAYQRCLEQEQAKAAAAAAPTFVLAFDSGASQEVDESVSEMDSYDASFISAGGELPWKKLGSL